MRRLFSTITAMTAMTAVAVAVAVAPSVASAQTGPEVLPVYAAGSLRAAMSDLARAFERDHRYQVQLSFGASGLLKDRIAAGEPAQVFASANMSHPQALLAAGRADAVTAFARNTLCLLAAPGFSLQGKTLARRLLDAELRVGTSTPRADPSGDYAFQMFERIESSGAAGPGSAAVLKAKALQLTGGPTSPPPPAGRNVYGQLVEAGAADVFVTYCTNATEAQRQVPELQILAIADAINVSAVYGMATVMPASPAARAFVEFVAGAEGQQILGQHGFSRP